MTKEKEMLSAPYKVVKCDRCNGTGKNSLGPVTHVHEDGTETTSHDDCWGCEGKGEYLASLTHKQEYNIWDHIDDFKKVHNMRIKKEWTWVRNWDCKYIELRIDMRSGHCIIKNKNGDRISPEQLEYQYRSEDDKEGEETKI